jgi:hypothetical protein
MKLLRREGDRFEFRLGRREKGALTEVLGAFPVIPIEHHRLSRGRVKQADDPNQALLTDAMTAFKTESRRRLDRFLEDRERFVADERGYRVRLGRDEVEWLLRVLNDVRVGCWIRLGSPEPDEEAALEASDANLRHLALMHLAGEFEYALVAALDGTQGVGWGPRSE